ncbi:MAG: sigma-70 family RNA polymerase sigma factor [Planctomycetes bacterium]|nr:sigma-70 family RNA polymerase sigma factor [Planctomycetota bacterium]
MPTSSQILESARPNDVPDLERFRSYLRLLARLDLDPRLLGKLDLSGVIQETLFEAHRALPDFRGQGDDALLLWLRQILVRNLIDEIRRLRRVKSDVIREEWLDDLSSVAETRLAAAHSSPRARAIRNEDLLRLARALGELPDDQQTAIVRHHLQGVSLADVAVEMSRTKPAVAGLLHRGMSRLRDLLGEDSARL